MPPSCKGHPAGTLAVPSAYLAVWSPHSTQTVPVGSGCLLDPHSPAVSPTARSTDTFLPLYSPHFTCCSTSSPCCSRQATLFHQEPVMSSSLCLECSPKTPTWLIASHPSKLCSYHLFITSHPEFKTAISPCFPASASFSLQQSAPSSTGYNDLLIHYASCLSLPCRVQAPGGGKFGPFCLLTDSQDRRGT